MCVDSCKRMICYGFLSPSERRELEACVHSQREDHGVARRANAILLRDDGKSCQSIAEFLYRDDNTMRGWYKTCREDGWKGGQSCFTVSQEAELCVWLEGHFCRSTTPITAHILKEFGLVYSHSGCLPPSGNVPADVETLKYGGVASPEP